MPPHGGAGLMRLKPEAWPPAGPSCSSPAPGVLAALERIVVRLLILSRYLVGWRGYFGLCEVP